MAKKVYKINNFEGGINQKSDARDIGDNELSSAFNVNISDTGKIKLTGNGFNLWSTTNDFNQTHVVDDIGSWYYMNAVRPANFIITQGIGIKAGYGLFTCSHDFTSNGMSWGVEGISDGNDADYIVPNPQKSEFVLLNDGAHIDLWDSCWNNNGTKGDVRWIQRAITLGNAHGVVKPTYYKAEGGIRVCDGNFNEGTTAYQINDGAGFDKDDMVLTINHGTFDESTNLDDNTYIRINDEILQIIGVRSGSGNTQKLDVRRAQFQTQAVKHSDDDWVYKINVPKILKHVNRPMLKNAYILSGNAKTFPGVPINAWIDDIQCLEPPEEARAVSQYRAVAPSTNPSYVISSTPSGVIHRGRGLAVFEGPVTAMAKIFNDLTDGANYSIEQQKASMALYPNDKEKVLFSVHESNSATDSEHSLSQYEQSGGVGDVPTVEITSADGINWAAEGFVKGKQVIISGTTEINGLADIVGTGSSASILEITASMTSEEVTTAIAGNEGMTARLESNRIDENLQNQFVFGMSYMYEGGGGEMQESPIKMGHLHQSFIGHDASLCNIKDGWERGTDKDAGTAIGTATGSGWYHKNGTIRCGASDASADDYLIYRASSNVIDISDTDESSGAGDGLGDTRYYVAIDVELTSNAKIIVYPPGMAEAATAGFIGGTEQSNTTGKAIIYTGTYLFEATAHVGSASQTAVFCARFDDGAGGEIKIKSAQVYRFHPYRMSATNAIDMRSWEGIPRFFSSFNMNNSDAFKWNERISGYKIYMKQVDSATETLSDEWLLGLKVDFESGNFTNYTNNSVESPLNIVTDYDTTLTSLDHYQSIIATNIQEVNDTHSQLGKSDFDVMRNIPLQTYQSENEYAHDTVTCAMYKTSTVVNGKMFIGNLKIGGITYPDRMIETPAFKFDTFPNDGLHNVDVALGDGDEIVHLESVNNKIIQFKRYTAYLLQVDSEEIDLIDTWKNMGISNPCQVVKAGSGVVWVNNHGLYYYDGDTVSNITGNKFSMDKWSIGEDDALPPMLIYDVLSNKVIIQTSNVYAKSDGGYIYDMLTSSIVEVQNVFKWYQGDNTALQEYHSSDLDVDEINNNDNIDTSPVKGLDPLTNLPDDFSVQGGRLPGPGSGRQVAVSNTFRSNAVISRNKKILFATNVYNSDKIEFHTWDDIPKYLHSYNKAANHFEIKTKDIDFGNPSRRKKIYKVYVTFKAGGYMSGVLMNYAINGSDDFSGNTFGTITGYDNNKGFDSFQGSKANSTDDWITVALKPTSAINNIYSLQLKFKWADAGHVDQLSGHSSHVYSSSNTYPTVKLNTYAASTTDDYYNGMPFMIYQGNGYGWDYRVYDYDGTGNYNYPDPLPPGFTDFQNYVNPDGTDGYNVDNRRRANIDRVANGLSGTSNEISVGAPISGGSFYQIGHIPKQFEINDVTIVYREKSIK